MQKKEAKLPHGEIAQSIRALKLGRYHHTIKSNGFVFRSCHIMRKICFNGGMKMGSNRAVIACVYSTKQMPYERHAHNAHELIYVCAGRSRVRIRDAEYVVGPHTLVFISKLEEHSVEILEGEQYLRYFIEFSPAQLDRMVEDPKLKSVFVSRPEGFLHCMDVTGVHEKIEQLLKEMLQEYKQDLPFAQEAFEAMFLELMVIAYRMGKERFPLPQAEFHQAIYRAQQYIDENFTGECSVTELAKSLFLSPYYLSHAFKAWTGYSPKQYIMLSRLSYAKSLLMTTGLSIAEISAKCGFGDVNNFIRSFRKETGQTPNQYRKINR